MACWSSVSNGSFVARRRSIRFDLVAVLIFGVLLNTTSMFNHDNVRIADNDLILRWVVVTPDMHRAASRCSTSGMSRYYNGPKSNHFDAERFFDREVEYAWIRPLDSGRC
jgi:hypothetical protein